MGGRGSQSKLTKNKKSSGINTFSGESEYVKKRRRKSKQSKKAKKPI